MAHSDDIRSIAPDLPGAELTETVNETSYKGQVSVPLGPVSFTFAGLAKIDEIDPVNRTAHVTAEGTDAEGRGFAVGNFTFRVVPSGDGSQVLVHTNVALAGAVADLGMSAKGFARSSAEHIMTKFAENLRARIAGSRAA